MPDFLKRDCFEVLAVSFQKSIKSFLLQLFPFLLLLTLSSSLLFFFFLYYLFDFIFNLSYYMIFCLSIILLFFYLFFFPFIYFLFQVHFCSIFFIYFPFAVFFSFCASNESAIRCFICMSLFFVNPPRRTRRPSKLPRKLKSLLPLSLFYYRS